MTRVVGLSFFLNGLAFASWAGRIPDVRAALSLSAPQLGLLLLAMSVGSVGALASSGALIHRHGPRAVVLAGVVLVSVGMSGLSFGVALGSVPVAAVALATYGVGSAVWDVAMNVEGAEVERASGRPIMPRFHAAFSLGTVAGALLAVLGTRVDESLLPHLLPVMGIVALVGVLSGRRFVLGAAEGEEPSGVAAAWREPRTLLVGVLVLVLALTEGTANDWLAVALEDGYDASRHVAVLGFATFVAAMTTGRLLGPALLERHGRVRTVAATMVLSLVGVFLVVFGGVLWLVVPGIVMWGVGASLGFPVGMSAAADDPARAAARVSVVSTIGYTAFLAGPPVLGFLAGAVGTLHALLVLGILVTLALPLVGWLRPVGAGAGA